MNPPSPRPWTPQEKINVTFFLLDLLSMPLLPFLRRRLGFRLLAPLRWFPLCFLLFTFTNPLWPGAVIWIEHAHPREMPFPDAAQVQSMTREQLYQALTPPPPRIRAGNGSGYLGIFAFLCILLAARQRSARARDIKHGIPVHSYSRGVSVFSFLPFAQATVNGLIDSLVVIVIGFAIADTFSPLLGGWLVVSGFALRMVEGRVAQLQLERSLDAVDGMLESQSLADTVQQFEHHPSAHRMERGDIEIIHTKLSPDVEALIARRKPSPPSGARASTARHVRPARPLMLGKRLRRWGGMAYAGARGTGKALVKLHRTFNPAPTEPLTPRQRFYRIFWRQPFWWRPLRDWWHRRQRR